MIPSDIPRAIEILQGASESILESRITVFICHELEDLAPCQQAAELRDYVRGDLRANTVQRFGNVLECVLPGDLYHWAEATPGIDALMRAAWCDKMIYDLQTKGELP